MRQCQHLSVVVVWRPLRSTITSANKRSDLAVNHPMADEFVLAAHTGDTKRLRELLGADPSVMDTVLPLPEPLVAPFSSPLEPRLAPVLVLSVITSIHCSLLSGFLYQALTLPVSTTAAPSDIFAATCSAAVLCWTSLLHSAPLCFLCSSASSSLLLYSLFLCHSNSLLHLPLSHYRACRWMWTASLGQKTLVPQHCS